MSQNEDLLKLLDRIKLGEATEEEIREYNKWCNSLQDSHSLHRLPVDKKAEMLTKVQVRIGEEEAENYTNQPVRQYGLWRTIAVASLIGILITIGITYRSNRAIDTSVTQIVSKEIEPGSDRAILTLSDGQTIVLDSAQNGLVVTQLGTDVLKSDPGSLIYKQGDVGLAGGSNRAAISLVTYNTLTVPRSGKFQLILPDGTKVWLNASSSIKYPTSFTGKERRVAITGEVYMEVAKDSSHPFFVSTRRSEIKVLGTHFNIMAYVNEPAVTTTLLEGSIQLSVPGSRHTVIIKPGQQASVKNDDDQIDIRKVNPQNATAWIQNLISLDDCSVESLMNQLSRWYDVDIEYEGKIPNQSLGGMISRYAVLSNVLAALGAAGVHTRVEGKKIIVLPN